MIFSNDTANQTGDAAWLQGILCTAVQFTIPGLLSGNKKPARGTARRPTLGGL